jgi:hypothetical protein
MSRIVIRPAEFPDDVATVRALFSEYADSLVQSDRGDEIHGVRLATAIYRINRPRSSMTAMST